MSATNGRPRFQVLEVDVLKDEIDRVGPRCRERHPDLGPCHRRFDHAHLGDEWHHSLTSANEAGKNGRYWKWKEA